MITKSSLERMLHPKSIAVVGARRDSTNSEAWMDLFASIVQFGYKGRLYPINPKADVILGYKAYPSITSLPTSVDLVIITLSAPHVPSVLSECATTGNRNVQIFSAGFKETGEEEGLKLQQEIEEIAKKGELSVIGPNCMGLYIPKAGLSCWRGVSEKSGSVAFLSQSGGFAEDFSSYAVQLNICFSKVISYGNALTIDGTDLLTYLSEDDDTRFITMYLEGVRNSRRLLEMTSKINITKPVIIVKAGQSDSGIKAISSHTGSLAGAAHFWDAFFRQTGAVRAYSVEDLVHVTLMFQNSKPPNGNRLAILGAGGAFSVIAADACNKEGLEIPAITSDTQKKLRSIIPAAGNIIRNPIDANLVMNSPSLMQSVLEVLGKENYIDMLLLNLHVDWMYDYGPEGLIETMGGFLSNDARRYMNDKPFAVALRSYRADQEFKHACNSLEKVLRSAGVPVFRNIEQPISCLARLSQYHNFIRKAR
jgi:acyl-CoA synthetase (NDP forming)